VTDLLQHVARSIHSRELLRRKQRILVAVSGGVDSMVLLHVLHRLAANARWQLAVAHLNHQLRGRNSNADEKLVKLTAKKLGLQFVGGRANVRLRARDQKESIEMAARRERHNFLARVAARRQIDTIALAHHADDQIELFFLRLFRGSGGDGLSGMKWCNASPVNPKLKLIRPLLDVNKADLKEFARENKVAFREDASNRRLDIQRNRIRKELLPLLRRKYQPAVDRTVLRVMEITGADAEFANQAAIGWLREKRRPAYDKLAPAVQRRCIQLQLLEKKLRSDYELVEWLRMNRNRAITVSPLKIVLLTADGELRMQQPEPAGAEGSPIEVELKKPAGTATFGNLEIHWRIKRRPIPHQPEYGAGREFFDADKVGSRIIFRHWRPGDRFQPIGMPASVKLQDLFANRKIPRSQRHELVVVTNKAKAVVWVEKLRISEQFKLSKQTKRILQWHWKRL
jgi:tRNA(Ile)-lysidine synthase